jgi:hypothetical protein
MTAAPSTIWPPEQSWLTLPGSPPVLLAHFADHAAYHPGLAARIMALLDDRTLAKRYARVASGTKIHHLERWNCAEADLVNARAQEFFKRALRSATASVDLSWATVYRTGDYTAPHSHLRAQASIVYCIDPGDDPRPDTPDGKLCLVDPRYSMCCNIEPNRMTTVVIPDMRAGMICSRANSCTASTPTPGRPRLTPPGTSTSSRSPARRWRACPTGHVARRRENRFT